KGDDDPEARAVPARARTGAALLDRVIGRDLGDAEGLVRRERKGEKKRAQTVRPAEKRGTERFSAVERPQLPLRPARDRPSHLEHRTGSRTTREHEVVQLRMRRLELMDVGLEPFNMAGRDGVVG